MKTDSETDLRARLAALFRRWPALCGFTVHGELDGDLVLADVDVQPFTGHRPSDLLRDEIAAALLEVLEERPEAREFMRGRTFARTLQ